MKKTITLGLMIILGSFSKLAHADLTRPGSTAPVSPIYTQSNPYYMQGQGAGASYYNPNSYQQNQSLQYQQYFAQQQQQQQMQKATNTTADLLWLFTGSQGSLGEQAKTGFKSSGTTTFWNRFWSILGSAAYRRIAPSFDRLLGSADARISTIGQGGVNSMYNQQGATGYCYACTHPSTNPNATNPYAMNPAIFTPTTATPSSGGAGGIVH